MLLQSVIAANLILLAKAIIHDEGTTEQRLIFDNITGNTSDVKTTTERPTCIGTEWQCDDGACVPEDHKCDGAFHCEDGSDETRANCKGVKRHMLGLLLHCTADRSNKTHGVCPDICKAQPEYCAYAIITEQLPKDSGVCVLPDFVRNGTYKVTKLDRTSSAYGYNDFYLEFKCDNETELVGEERPECDNGTWNSTMPFCAETCKLKRNEKLYTYTCKRGDKSKKCGDFVAIGTEVIVEKLDKKISNSTIKASAMCTEDKKLNVSIDCVSVVERRQGEFEKDIMNQLSYYENKFKETKHPSYAFEELVRNYRKFEDDVTKNNTDLWIQVTKCDMYLDLMENQSS